MLPLILTCLSPVPVVQETWVCRLSKAAVSDGLSFRLQDMAQGDDHRWSLLIERTQEGRPKMLSVDVGSRVLVTLGGPRGNRVYSLRGKYLPKGRIEDTVGFNASTDLIDIANLRNGQSFSISIPVPRMVAEYGEKRPDSVSACFSAFYDWYPSELKETNKALDSQLLWSGSVETPPMALK